VTPPGELWYNYLTVTDLKYQVRWSSVSSLHLKHEVMYNFQLCQYSGLREAPFEFSNAALLWCSDLAIENALCGWKIGEGVVGFWSPTNSIVLSGFQTTVQSFMKSVAVHSRDCTSLDCRCAMAENMVCCWEDSQSSDVARSHYEDLCGCGSIITTCGTVGWKHADACTRCLLTIEADRLSCDETVSGNKLCMAFLRTS